MHPINKKDYRKGKCKICGEKTMLYLGLCQKCHGRLMKQAQRDGLNKNPFIG
jgi:hypothetical protein